LDKFVETGEKAREELARKKKRIEELKKKTESEIEKSMRRMKN